MKKAFSGVIDGSWFPGSLICSFPYAFQEEDDRICGSPQILCSVGGLLLTLGMAVRIYMVGATLSWHFRVWHSRLGLGVLILIFLTITMDSSP